MSGTLDCKKNLTIKTRTISVTKHEWVAVDKIKKGKIEFRFLKKKYIHVYNIHVCGK
jgi:hypothetical protein